MTEQEKHECLKEKIKELDRVTREIESLFPEKSFKLDGILIGNIVEVMAANAYGVTLYKQSEKTHDGEVGGKKVQIKGTQRDSTIVIREEPEYLLVLFLDKENGVIKEIYNGPGHEPWQFRNYVSSMNFYTMSVNKLLELDRMVKQEEKIHALIPIEKYVKLKVEPETKESIVKHKKQAVSKGKTLQLGYINRNRQENIGCLNKPGTHIGQTLYQMKCTECGYLYEANGCDIGIRKCPSCSQCK